MTAPTKRERGLKDMHAAIAVATGMIEEEWPKAELDDPMVRSTRKAIIRIRQYDKARLEQLSTFVEAILLNAEGFALMFDLATKKPMEFQALVVLAQVELERKAEAVAA
jgi:hypothetical protein